MGAMAGRVQALSDGQMQLAGGLTAVSDAQAKSQAMMMQTLEKRLEEVTKSMGETLHGTSTRTARSLGALQMRLESIDKAQTFAHNGWKSYVEAREGNNDFGRPVGVARPAATGKAPRKKAAAKSARKKKKGRS